MALYRPPLLQRSKNDVNVQPEIQNPLKGLEHSYMYTGCRVGNSGNIELEVCTVVMDSEENLYLRVCSYSGQKDTWKEVIKNQLIQHLGDIGVENGLIKSETRYFEISKELHFKKEEYDKRLLDLIAKVKRER